VVCDQLKHIARTNLNSSTPKLVCVQAIDFVSATPLCSPERPPLPRLDMEIWCVGWCTWLIALTQTSACSEIKETHAIKRVRAHGNPECGRNRAGIDSATNSAYSKRTHVSGLNKSKAVLQTPRLCAGLLRKNLSCLLFGMLTLVLAPAMH
jgi:hypothetical protein